MERLERRGEQEIQSSPGATGRVGSEAKASLDVGTEAKAKASLDVGPWGGEVHFLRGHLRR